MHVDDMKFAVQIYLDEAVNEMADAYENTSATLH